MPAPRRPRPPFRARPGLEALDGRDTPALLAGAELVVGADAGSPPLVRVIDASTQTVQAQLLAFGGDFYGGVRVAVGDVNGDGVPDLVCAAGPSGGPRVEAFSGADGAVLASFLAFAPDFTGGVNIAVGDVTGDGTDDIIAGAGAGGGPAVAVFDGSGNPVTSFFAYAQNFNGGVRVAAADTTGDGSAEVVTAPGHGGGPDVRLWQVLGRQYAQAGGFGALSPTFTGGQYVAAGDVNGDGKDEVIVGAGSGGGPQVQVFAPGGDLLTSYFAYAPDFTGGVRVGAADLTGDGRADVLTAAGPGGASQVNLFDGPSAAPTTSLFGFPANQLTGAFVAGSARPLAVPSTPADQISAAYARLATYQQNNQLIVPVDVTVNNYYGGYYPYGGYGFGYPGLFYGGLYGATYFDGPGLYAPVGSYYGQSFFGPGYFGNANFVTAPTYYAPGAVPSDPVGAPSTTPELLPAPTPVADAPVEAVASAGYPGFGGYYGYDDYPSYGGFGDFGGFDDFGGFGDFGGDFFA